VRNSTLGLLLATAATAAIAGCERAPAPVAPARNPALARDFTARDLDGKQIRLSDSRGERAVLLSFFATWCAPCVQELPHLRKLYEANKDRGFLVLAISVDGAETVANVANFEKRNQLPFPTLIDTDSAISNIYNPHKSVPYSVLIDKTGTIVRVREGYQSGDEELVAKDVETVLARQ
jgi:peroxiredoxin